MAHLEPSIALATSERALRQLMTMVFTAQHGPGWIRKVARDVDVVKWQEKAEVEAKKRTTRGVARVSSSELDYAELYQLIQLIEKNWALFSPALGDKKITLALLARLDDLRNTVAHSREVLPFESDLLAGIAGEIRNRVTLYMSSQGPAGEYYPRIESVTDSFGNVVDGARALESSNPHLETKQTLDVGDVVTFQCRGTDPQGRDIAWSLTGYPGTSSMDAFTGNDGELRWEVGVQDVSDTSWVQITMKSVDDFHRWPEGRDGFAAFGYRVRPPQR